MKRINFKDIKIKQEYRPIINRYEVGIHNDLNLPDEVKNNFGICVSISCFYAKIEGVNFNELLSDTLMGLILYSKNYDKDKKYKFSSYITKYLQGIALTSINKTKNLIRIKNNDSTYDIKVISLDEIVHYNEISQSNRNVYLLDILTNDEDIEKEALDEEKKQQDFLIKKMLNKLSKKQRYVIEEHYLKERDLQHIATELGLTRQAVSELKRNALKKIQKTIKLK